MNMRQIKAIEQANKKRILSVCPEATENTGIYIMKREEDGFRYAYIGQAKHLLTRLAQHLTGYQHIDLSIKKHGLWSENNPTGWKIGVIECEVSELDELEKKYILAYANKGYQLRNVTKGGQGEGKTNINESRPAKTYRDGLKQGYKNAQKYVANLFDKHLTYAKKSDKPNKNQEKAMQKFAEFIDFKEGNNNG